MVERVSQGVVGCVVLVEGRLAEGVGCGREGGMWLMGREGGLECWFQNWKCPLWEGRNCERSLLDNLVKKLSP